jgi:DNA (cytosine-5)-methyltransferase 1
MKHGSLFSGIGGFDLAAEWMGWENVFHCEWNEFGQKILKHYWPNAISYGDITKTDFIIHRGTIDILTGGFPCQPYSLAGKRKGKEDDRHLWPEMLRAIHEIQPTFIVGENVPGLINWSRGLVFEEVQANLEIEGYEIIPFILPACGVNAPHKRERIWFIAYSTSRRKRKLLSTIKRDYTPKKWSKNSCGSEKFAGSGNASYSECIGQQGQGWSKEQMHSKTYGNGEANWSNSISRWPTQSPICGRNDGLSHRVDRLHALGNAIVPQVALQIFKAIEQFNNLNQ